MEDETINSIHSIRSLLSLCISNEEDKANVEKHFSQMCERILQSPEIFSIDLYQEILDQLIPAWSFNLGATESKHGLLIHLFNFMKDIAGVFLSFDTVRLSIITLEMFVQDTSKPFLSKTAISTMTVFFPVAHQFVYKASIHSLENEKLETFYHTLEHIRDKITLLFYVVDNDGLKNVIIKWIHMLILVYSAANKSVASDILGLEIIPENHPFLKKESLALLGRDYLDKFLLACHSDTMTSGNITAIINSLIPLIKIRPQFIPIVLPVLLELYDSPPRQFTESQTKSIFHTLKLQLSNLLKLSLAIEFGPMIQQLLNEINSKSKSMNKEKDEKETSKKSTVSSIKMERPLTIPEGSKIREKLSFISQDRRLPFEPSKMPLTWIIDIIIGSLMSCSVTDIDLAIRVLSGQMKIDNELEKNSKAVKKAPSQVSESFVSPEDEDSMLSAIEVNDISTIIDKQKLLSEIEIKRLLKFIFDKLCNSIDLFSFPRRQILWSDIMTKLCFLLKELDVDIDEASNKSLTFETKSFSIKFGYFIDRLFNIVFSEGFPEGQRLYTCLLYLFREYFYGEVSKRIDLKHLHETFIEKYMHHFMHENEHIHMDLSITRFIVLSPIYSEEAIKDYFLKCLNDDDAVTEIQQEKVEKIIAMTQELLVARPTSRTSLLPLILRVFISMNTMIRSVALSTCQSALFNPFICPSTMLTIIDDFATIHLLNIQKVENIYTKELMEDDENGANKDEQIFSNLSKYCDLFLSLCQQRPALLLILFPIYNSVDLVVQKNVLKAIEPLVKDLYHSRKHELLEILKSLPEGNESLFLDILNIIACGQMLPSDVIDTVKFIVNHLSLDARYLIPVLHGLEKSDIISYLSKFIDLLNGKPEERAIVQEIFVKILSPLTKGSLSPIELLVHIHLLESRVGLKKAMEAVQICFSMPDIFKQEVFAATLQQLIDKTPIPTLFMRTAIQALNLYRSLVNFMSTLLFKLVSKKVWQHPSLWEGFIKCCQIMQPTSLQILIQLPSTQLTQILHTHPEMKLNLKMFLQQQPPSLRVRFNNLMTLLDSK